MPSVTMLIGMAVSMTRSSVAGAVGSSEVRHLGVITNEHEVEPALCMNVGMHRSLGTHTPQSNLRGRVEVQ